MDDFEKELKLGFLDEAEQSIADVERTFLDLEAEPQNVEHINKIFRLAHNLKGSSRAVGFEQFGAFTHEFESFVLKVKNGEIPVTAKVVGQLLISADFVKIMITQLRSDLSAQFDIQPKIAEFHHFTDAPAPLATEESAPVEIEDVVEAPLKIEVSSASVTPATVIEEPKKVHVQTPAPTAGNKPATTAVAEESIRVGLSKVEQLINYVGEMVILQSVLQQNANTTADERLKKSIAQLGKVAKDIQDISMGLRMIPVKPTFQKMMRIVRDTSQSLGKNVQLLLSGEDTEIDKSVLESINDPLVHLVRNSVDHGIEPTEKRKENNKPEAGRVELKAFHRAGRLVIEVVDDGGGLNAEKLKQRAIEKGIISDKAELSEQECFKLIFAPGFSTKEQVTEISGRGVGMDVVKTNIEKIGGEVQIESKLGEGTTIRINLPLTLAIIEGLVVANNGQKFVVPLSHVCETVQPDANQIYNEKNLGTILLLRGENIPLYYLGDFFNQKKSAKETDMIALIFKSNGRSFAILVEDILNQQQVVVKRLSRDMSNMKGISGTTILGDGKPSLILEPNELLLRPVSRSQYIETDSALKKVEAA